LEHARGNFGEGNEYIRKGIQKLKDINNVVYIPDSEKTLVSTPVQKQYTLWEQQGVDEK
jgi:hypothetical protein